MAKQVKSKERVVEHGEVFTNEREVKAMCDLVANECERLDSRFLEPACGDGNFLAEIVSRKLERCKKLYKSNAYDYERYSVLVMTSIYGVDLLKDNVEVCRKRLFDIWNKEYMEVCKKNCNDETKKAVEYILTQNILCGNALTMMQVDENQEDTDNPIIFPEWSLIMGTKLKRRDFRFDELLEGSEKRKGGQEQLSIFDFGDDISINENPKDWIYDAEIDAYIPGPIKDYPAVSYKKIMEVK